VLLKAGVAEANPDYDPMVPYSQQILITKPQQICSFDETKIELDCTKGGKGKGDTIVKTGPTDDGTAVVTKSDKCASAVCGRLGDGRSLPVYICFASGESYDPAWAPHYACDDILDKELKPLSWRYISNAKGSITEEYCADYIKHVIHPALGYPKPRDTHPGEQGVIICDGVGTHLGYHVVKMAIELGIEILLRVPHLSFVLQGEDTVNFKVTACLFSTCLRAFAAAVVVVVVAAAAASAYAYDVAAAAANAYADADVTRSDDDAHPSAFDAAAYAAANDANADANMPNVACHLARAYASVVAASVAAGS
jgi:hypothetical protein